MSTVALARMDVLFTDDEMARCNTPGSKGFEQLGSSFLSFLFSGLKNKFDLPIFGEKLSGIKLSVALTLNVAAALLFSFSLSY